MTPPMYFFAKKRGKPYMIFIRNEYFNMSSLQENIRDNLECCICSMVGLSSNPTRIVYGDFRYKGWNIPFSFSLKVKEKTMLVGGLPGDVPIYFMY